MTVHIAQPASGADWQLARQFLLARDGDVPCGCVGLRRCSDDAGEIKRLYVVPMARRRRLGRQLATRLVAIAREIGYQRLLLDTLPAMGEAQALYRSLGFRDTAPYRFNPIAGSVFLVLQLPTSGRGLATAPAASAVTIAPGDE